MLASVFLTLFSAISGDEQRVRELDYEIRALDETPREQDRTNSLAKIAVINQRNRKKNREIMEAAILVMRIL